MSKNFMQYIKNALLIRKAFLRRSRTLVLRVLDEFGFQIARQRGSHIVLKKETPEGKVGTVVPMHPEIKIGTLKGILEQAKVSVEEFSQYI